MAESLGRYVTSISKYLNYFLNQKFSEYNLNMHEVQLLIILYERPGSSQDELAEQAKLDKILVSKRLNNLGKNDFIKKEKNSDDKRIKNIYPTAKAEKMEEDIKEILHEATEVLSQGFSEKENKLVRKLLKEMLDNIYEEVMEVIK